MSLLLSDDPELRRYGTPLGRKASYNAAYQELMISSFFVARFANR